MLLGVSFADVVQVTWGGLAAGSAYVLVLVGILLVYQVSRAVNFAHGAFGMFAAFGSYYLYDGLGLPPWSAVALGLLAAMGLAMFTDRVILSRTPVDRPGYDLVVTLGVLLLLTAVAESWFGNNTYSYLDLLTRRSVMVGDVFISMSDTLLVGLVAVLLGAGRHLFRRTTIGLSIRAAASLPDVAETVGVSVSRIRGGVWAVSGLLAGVAGVILASRLSVNAFYMTPILIKAFIAGIAGGLDRYLRPIVAAFALGMYEAWVVFGLGARYRTPAVFVLIILLLMLAPTRLLQERTEARA